MEKVEGIITEKAPQGINFLNFETTKDDWTKKQKRVTAAASAAIMAGMACRLAVENTALGTVVLLSLNYGISSYLIKKTAQAAEKALATEQKAVELKTDIETLTNAASKNKKVLTEELSTLTKNTPTSIALYTLEQQRTLDLNKLLLMSDSLQSSSKKEAPPEETQKLQEQYETAIAAQKTKISEHTKEISDLTEEIEAIDKTLATNIEALKEAK